MKRFRAENYWKYFEYSHTVPVKIHHLHTRHEDLVLHCSEFIPTEIRSVAFIGHGYFDHSSWMLPLIEGLVKRGVRVITYDLPGHGLSTGERGKIQTFHRYSEVFQDVYQRFHDPLLPEHFLGFSTGCVGWIDWALLRQQSLGPIPDFKSVFLFAPLIKITAQELTKLPQWIGPLIDYQFPRKPSKRAIKDPLALMSINTFWLGSLMEWNEELKFAKPDASRSVHYWSGAYDLTVDWHYNRDFLRGHLTLSERIFPKTGHRIIDNRKVMKEFFSFWDRKF